MPEQIEIVGSGFVPGIPGIWGNISVPIPKPEEPPITPPAETQMDEHSSESSESETKSKRRKEL